MNCKLLNELSVGPVRAAEKRDAQLTALWMGMEKSLLKTARRYLPLVLVSASLCACTSIPSISLEQSRLMQLAKEVELRGDAVSAVALYERAAVLSDEAPAVMLELGNARLRGGDLQGAEQALHSVLTQQPESAQAMFGLGTAQLHAGDFNRAADTLAIAAPKIDSAVAYNRLGSATVMSGRVGEAIGAFTLALAREPGNLEFRTNLALALALNGQSVEAIEQIARVAAASSANTNYLRRQLLVLILAGYDRQAAATLPDMQLLQKRELIAKAHAIKVIKTPEARARAIGLFATQVSR
jgi:Flp pilus assembly protein TadD